VNSLTQFFTKRIKTLVATLSRCYKTGHLFRPRTVALLTLFAHPLLGGVVLDGSFGTKGALPGPNYMIAGSMGKLVNTNLFQSFSQFNVNSSESATFTGPSTVHNILARVTNGSPSSIDGTINSAIQGANLFFMNPAGVMFGKNAQLNVSGSFAVTTANYLKFVGGGRFNANLGGGDVLTSAPVSAFGFLNSTPAPVSFSGSTLNVAPLKSFSVVAGDISLNGAAISGQGSRVNLVSVKSPGEVQLDVADINSEVDVSQFTALGTINVTNSAVIDTTGLAGGPVVIRCGSLYLLDSSKIFSETTEPSGSGGDVTVTADSLVIRGSGVATDTVGDGKAGTVKLAADSILIDGGFVSSSSIAGEFAAVSGGGGDIIVHAHDLEIINNSRITTDTQSLGNAGNVSLAADSLLIDGSQVSSSSTNFGFILFTGNGGGIMLKARDLKILNSSVTTDTFAAFDLFSGPTGSGNAGEVKLTADSLLIDGSQVSSTSFGFSFNLGIGNAGDIIVQAGQLRIVNDSRVATDTSGTGGAGNVVVQAGDLTITGGGEISSSTSGLGNGGDVNVTANSLLIDGTASPLRTFISADAISGSSGNAGNVIVQAGDLTLTASGYISANAGPGSSGTAGDVTVHADNLAITMGGFISATAFGQGNGGDVMVTAANSLSIDGAGSAIAATAQPGSRGKAGSIVVEAHDLRITHAGGILATTFSRGDGGNINVMADSLLIDGGGSAIAATAEAGSSGKAGSIFIDTAGPLKLSNEASISTFSETTDAGSINILSNGPVKLRSGSGITVSAPGGDGGNITIKAPVLVSLFDSEIDATAGKVGGNITIDPIALQLKNSTISASAPQGQGGQINLFTSFLAGPVQTVTSDGTLLLAFDSSISATGGTANGTINVTAPSLDLGAELITLPVSTLSAESQLQERCTALLQGDFSSFISIGRGGTEPTPEELQNTF
jgi:filamentous hemagglutinin family protein